MSDNSGFLQQVIAENISYVDDCFIPLTIVKLTTPLTDSC